MMYIHFQQWFTLDLCVIADEYGTVTLEHYKAPVDCVQNYICNLSVDHHLRGKGHGRKLLQQAEKIAWAKGFEDVYLEWDSRDTPKWVLNWYLRNGYEEVKRNIYKRLLKKKITAE